jgi:hypothetical protein
VMSLAASQGRRVARLDADAVLQPPLLRALDKTGDSRSG